MNVTVNYPYTRAANLYFDLMGDMLPVEYKVTGAVIRHSVGWDSEYAELSYNDFMEITKIKSRTSLSKGIKSSIEKGYIAISEETGSRGKKRYTVGETLRCKPENKPLTGTMSVPIECTTSTMSVPDKPLTGTIDALVGNDDQYDERTITSTMSVPDKPLTGTMSVPHIKKEVLKEKNKKNILPDGQSQEIVLSEENLEAEANEQPVTEPSDEFMDKPYSRDEYEWYVESGRCTEEQLYYFVYCPVWHNYTKRYKTGDSEKEVPYVLNTIWESRQRFQRLKMKDTNSWDMTVDIIKHFWGGEDWRARQTATLLLGTAKTGKWKKHRLENPMSPAEVYAFGLWIFQMRCAESGHKPLAAEDINNFAQEFRNLSNHFEHVNYARHKIMDLFAEPEPAFVPDPDDERFHTAPADELDELYAKAEALGFPLSGEY